MFTNLMSVPDSASPISDFLQTRGTTDWERSPPSYDLQSSGSLDLNELRIFTPMIHLKLLSQSK